MNFTWRLTLTLEVDLLQMSADVAATLCCSLRAAKSRLTVARLTDVHACNCLRGSQQCGNGGQRGAEGRGLSLDLVSVRSVAYKSISCGVCCLPHARII